MKIIMYLAALESCFQLYMITEYYICRASFNKFFSWTVYFSTDVFSYARSTHNLQRMFMFGAALTSNMAVNLATCLCLDLVLMVRYPFDRTDGRTPKYVIASFLIAIFPAIFEAFHGMNFSLLKVGDTFSCICKTTFVIAFFCSTLYTCKKLRGAGFSKEVR